MRSPNACILVAPGINCNVETAAAFELAGATTEQVHISQLVSGERRLDDFQIFGLSGGFSYGDVIASGRILGTELRTRLHDDLNRFKEAGKVILGICNGFQVQVEIGLLPEGRVRKDTPKTATLAHNDSGHFECRWSRLAVPPSRCEFAGPEVLGNVIELPSANGEGKFSRREEEDYWHLLDNGQVVFRYVDASGQPTDQFPDNPNGSPYGIASICDESGLVLGMMPHPERFVRSEQYVNYHRNRTIQPHGLPLFESVVEFTKAA